MVLKIKYIVSFLNETSCLRKCNLKIPISTVLRELIFYMTMRKLYIDFFIVHW